MLSKAVVQIVWYNFENRCFAPAVLSAGQKDEVVWVQIGLFQGLHPLLGRHFPQRFFAQACLGQPAPKGPVFCRKGRVLLVKLLPDVNFHE